MVHGLSLDLRGGTGEPQKDNGYHQRSAATFLWSGLVWEQCDKRSTSRDGEWMRGAQRDTGGIAKAPAHLAFGGGREKELELWGLWPGGLRDSRAHVQNRVVRRGNKSKGFHPGLGPG